MSVMGLLTPIVWAAFGMVSENVFGITEPVWYGTISYLLGFFSAFLILWGKPKNI